MFRQSKKKLASRRNFDFNSSSGDVSNQVILSSTASTTEEEKKLYDEIYEGKVSFYELPPQGEITLHQFETWAIDRLKILLEIESCISRNKSLKEIESIIKPQFQKLLPFNTDNFEDRKKDYYSHYILRLCFCRSKELRDKFVRSEVLLFKIRYEMLTTVDKSKFVKSLNLPLLRYISDEEKAKFSKELYNTIAPSLQFQLNITDDQQKRQYLQQEKFIKLPFENVIDLVGSRQVFLKDGYAYLPQFQQLNLLTSEFSKNLMEDLIRTYQYLPRLNEDDRLVPILQHLSSGYTISDFKGDDYTSTENQNNDINNRSVNTDDIQRHFPLCAKNLMYGLKEHHHLRYNGRQQLSFFLKGIGLSCDEAMQFWTEAFAGRVSIDKFNKEYRYNFRHNYGLEGNRINYKPWDCRTILSKPRPARGEYHGCPYRDWNPDRLTSELKKMDLSQQQIVSVLDFCAKNEYTIACTKVFEASHSSNDSVSDSVDDMTHISHPNLYFERSRKWHEKREGKSEVIK
ncbi:hypothetical protein TPHA_0I02440 [Tetrapisispora phaffii CBS 4417]|uniref:DNA primase large subunit n=1 Tax=Tetrapisispora phaffii (strain ATCC 24235 / CBS 4417 / NBRC 1672 / NRRL Y-8282 / UCD 70-5) TaxID=1071381 RepID=G8BXW9_TETPH|nr:hypothetical protein TPHA_0I02440 [Tetrapisispora phaffii CBS 4417]CCE64747.1 hypothetical protein TPHA_0I02440 [Tetrapisispora phaffii CBS 4417]